MQKPAPEKVNNESAWPTERSDEGSQREGAPSLLGEWFQHLETFNVVDANTASAGSRTKQADTEDN
jgi:hypothetical protein